MPHISKQQIESKVFNGLYHELESLIVKTKAENARLVLSGLLTPTEKIMLTKRLAAGIMYGRGCSQYQVWNTLKVSPSTAARMKLTYERGAYDSVLSTLNDSQVKNIWPLIERISRGGLPPLGKGRWNYVMKKLDGE